MNFERLGPYRIERRIGRGGMGTVFVGVADVTGERVAVKVLSSAIGLDDGLHDRFAAEIDSLRMLHHPNIVRILGYGDEQGYRFYSMELVEGQSLQEAVESGRRFSWQEAARVAVQICRALKHAHDHGIVHRDIKPANLLFTTDGVVKLSDFGIAKLFGNTGMTADGGVIGTAEYMAPEQADGRPVTHRADLYSLGGVLYALATGRAPFRAKSLMDMLQLQRFADPEPPMRLNPTIPRALNDLILQLLEKDPAKRCPTALVVSRQLESLLAHSGKDEVASAPAPGGAGAPSAREAGAAASPNGGGVADQGYPVAEPHAATAVPSDVILAPDGAGHAGSVHDTTDFRVAPALARGPGGGPPAGAGPGAAGGAAATPSQLKPTAPRITQVAATYTPVARDEHRKFEDADEDAPVWISPSTWAIVGAMLSIGLLVWYWLQPPSAEKLYERISAAGKEGDVNRLIEVERDIISFQTYYSNDRRMAELQGYLDEIELHRLEKRFQFRARFLSKNDGLSPIERAYSKAIAYLQLDQSIGKQKLEALVHFYQGTSLPTKQQRDCLQLAIKQLDRLDVRMREQSAADRREVEARLKQARELAETDPKTAERIVGSVDELYGDEDWAPPLVAEARRALRETAERVAKQP
jgi:serine/threonine-protein kinase